MEQLVSIIVPVYNAEKYLKRCVDSILVQDYSNIELILMDDGSTDASGTICDDYAKQDGRVRVVHKENTGVSDTRNRALDLAEGVYVQFLDSDDWIEPETLEKTLEAGLREEADLVMFGFRWVDEAGKTLRVFLEDTPRDHGVTLREHPELLLTSPSAWCRLYRKELLQRTGLRFPPRV